MKRVQIIAAATIFGALPACDEPVVNTPIAAPGVPSRGDDGPGRFGSFRDDNTPPDFGDQRRGGDERPWTPPVILPVGVGEGESAPFDHPPVTAPLPTRPRLRVDIQQLDRNFQRVLGGITWTVDGVNQFRAFAGTLGVPNFIDSTFVDLNPTLLFQKFLADASRSACRDRMDADLALLDATGRAAPGGPQPVILGDVGLDDTLETAPERIDARLSRLVLLFHGRRIAPGTEAHGRWRWLFESSVQLSESTEIAWLAVCVALVSHPDFYTY